MVFDFLPSLISIVQWQYYLPRLQLGLDVYHTGLHPEKYNKINIISTIPTQGIYTLFEKKIWVGVFEIVSRGISTPRQDANPIWQKLLLVLL
jgi:hypothetical protein